MSTKKKVIALIILIAAITGMVLTGGFFQLIDFLVVRPIVNILFLTYNLVGDFGLAIIIFTILVKIAMFPLTKRQLRQTRLMKKHGFYIPPGGFRRLWGRTIILSYPYEPSDRTGREP